jgi:multidrug transporter EmrE-like cation transporter
MAWLIVIIAGIFEIGFAVLLKESHGITRIWPTIGFAACALISFGLLSEGIKRLEVGPAYAVWTGIGAAGTAIVRNPCPARVGQPAQAGLDSPDPGRRHRAQPFRHHPLNAPDLGCVMMLYEA